MIRLLVAAACIPALAYRAAAAPADNSQAGKLYVTSVASSLVEQGLAAAAPAASETAAFEHLNGPSIRMRNNEAQATTSPWVDANAWRFQRGTRKVTYQKLTAGSAPLAAAEAFTFNVEAILDPDPSELAELGKFLGFLKQQKKALLPVMANIGVVDDKSAEMDEVLNMLTRRNLLYRIVSAPDPKLDLTVQLGSKDFPRESAIDPSDFAARVRAKLGDDKRLVRLYGTSTVIAHLTGDGKQAQLYLLSYTRSGGRGQGGGRGQQTGGGAGGQPIRVRVLGHYRPVKFAAYGVAEAAKLTDVENPGGSTEFTVPLFSTLGIIDLEATK
jgi:hypothetical protein